MCLRSHLGTWQVQDSPLFCRPQSCALSTTSNCLRQKPIWQHFGIADALCICVFTIQLVKRLFKVATQIRWNHVGHSIYWHKTNFFVCNQYVDNEKNAVKKCTSMLPVKKILNYTKAMGFTLCILITWESFPITHVSSSWSTSHSVLVHIHDIISQLLFLKGVKQWFVSTHCNVNL